MKKILSIVASVLVLASCNSGNATQCENLNDSISALFGEMYGYGIAGQSKMGPDSAKFDKQAFLAGLEMAAKMDSTDLYKMQGMQLGIQLAQMQEQLKEQQKIDFDKDLFVAAFRKAFLSDSLKNPQELQMALMTMMERATREAKANDPVAKKNTEEGAAYAEKMQKEGYVKTQSGLVYKMLNEGSGETFTINDHIDVKYEGKLIDGTVFDATQGEETRSFSPNGVVAGFREALLMMKPGAKMIAVIPGELGYGIDGARGPIGPNATLIFTIETVGLSAAK